MIPLAEQSLEQRIKNLENKVGDLEELRHNIVEKRLEKHGWYRVAINDTNALSSFIHIYSTFNNNVNESITLLLNLYYSDARLKNISTLNQSNITKVRIVKGEDEKNYFEIYYSRDVGNRITIDILETANFKLMDFEETTEQTGTVTTELEITNN